jgi:hypothetical protein
MGWSTPASTPPPRLPAVGARGADVAVADGRHGWGVAGRRTECKLVTGIDDHSRYCVVAHLVVQATGRAVCQALVDGLRAWGLPGEVLTDIHSEWRADGACGVRPGRVGSSVTGARLSLLR